MAHSGTGLGPPAGDEDDAESYAKGTEVPPPPSYDEAVNLGMGATAASPEKRTMRPMQVMARPLSQIDQYKTSWLYPLMMRVKSTLQAVKKQVKTLEADTGTLGQEIKDVKNKSYLAILSLTVTGRVSHERGDALAPGVESLMNAPAFTDDNLSSRKMRYNVLKSDLRRDMRVIQSWLREQFIEDSDWIESFPRIPAISNFEVRELKSSMMKVESHQSSMESYRRSHPKETTLVDYAADLLLQMDMEYLWSFLVRMGDDEMDEEDDQQEEEDYVPEGDADGLREKRLQYYNKGSPPGADRSQSQEDQEEQEEQGEAMLKHQDEEERTAAQMKKSISTGYDEETDGGSSRYGGRDGDGDGDGDTKGSIATGGMAALSTTEEDRLRSRRLELYRQDSNRHGKSDGDIAEEVEMVPMVTIVTEEDVDVDLNSLPRSESPDSYMEAIEGHKRLEGGRYSPKHSYIVDGPEPGQEVAGAAPTTVEQFEIDDPDAETGRRRERRRRHSREYDVGSLPIPFLRELVNFVVRKLQYTKDRWPEWSLQKKLILVFAVLFVVGLVLLMSLLPASFVYVDYYEMGFVYNKVTGRTDIDRVYEFGCYLLAPQHSLVLFPSTAHFLDLDLSVMNKAGLTIGLKVYLQYLLRPNELALMYRQYQGEYENIVETMAESTVKNMAIEFTMDEYRLNRSMVEARLFHRLKRVLSGDCCNLDNDRYKRFQHSLAHDGSSSSSSSPTAVGSNDINQTTAATGMGVDDGGGTKTEPSLCNANTTSCDRGYHIDLAFFQLGAISIPSEVTSHYLKQVVLRVETEREQHIQEKAVEVKRTSLSVQNITNQANEIRAKANSKKVKIESLSKATRLQLVEQSYAQALKKTYDLLQITDEAEKTSLLFLNTLKNVKDNLVAFSYNYDKETVGSSP